MTFFSILTPAIISPERLKRQSPILYAGRICQMLGFRWAWSESRDPFLISFHYHIFGIGEATHFKFRVMTDT